MFDNKSFHFPPNVVAGMLEISVQSVRRWAEYHREHLSEGANPTPGKPRGFTWSDVETLRKIKAMRDTGMAASAINIALSASIESPTTPLPSVVSPIEPQTNTGELQSTQAIVVALQAMRTDIAALQEARQEDRDKRIDTVTAIGLGFGIGLVFCAILIGLAWLYGGTP